MSEPRYAIYFVPATDAPLGAFGTTTLGYDSTTGRDCMARPCGACSADEWRRITAEPRRYGFHATLKAPFRLRDGVSENDLAAPLAELGRTQRALDIGRLDVVEIGEFLALCPVAPTAALQELAFACVRALEHLRDPLTPEERIRRKPDRLSPRQIELLDSYGYPYVADEFRFHMTLSGPLEPHARAGVKPALRERFRSMVGDARIIIDAVSLLVQRDGAGAFRVMTRTALAKPQGRAGP